MAAKTADLCRWLTSCLLLALSGSRASAIPLPDVRQFEQREQQAKQKADIVIDVEQQYVTHYFEEHQTRLPLITATYRQWSHFRVLSVERNALKRTLPSLFALESHDYFPASPLNCISRPTISILAGELPCKEWKWVTPTIPPGERQNPTTTAPEDLQLKLWLQTSTQHPNATHQDATRFRVTKLAVERTNSASTTQTMDRGNAAQNQAPCLKATVACMISPCPPQQHAIACILGTNHGNETAQQGSARHQLILGGYVTEASNTGFLVDSGDYVVILGYRIYISGGILGNGGSDRTAQPRPGQTRPGSGGHYIQQKNIDDVIKIGSYVYVSCTIGALESMACGLDSSNRLPMITTSKALRDAWLPSQDSLN